MLFLTTNFLVCIKAERPKKYISLQPGSLCPVDFATIFFVSTIHIPPWCVKTSGNLLINFKV